MYIDVGSCVQVPDHGYNINASLSIVAGCQHNLLKKKKNNFISLLSHENTERITQSKKPHEFDQDKHD